MPRMIKHLSLMAALLVPLAPMAQAQGFAGAFLAAKSANIANDYPEAAFYYTRAMIGQPENGFIMQSAMFAYVAAGDVPAGSAIATKMTAAGFRDEYAQSVLIASAMGRQDYNAALALLRDPEFEIHPLISQMAMGWALIGSGQAEAGMAAFTEGSENDTIASFGRYNEAMALAYLGRFAEADTLFRQGGAYVNRGSLLAHAQILVALGQEDSALSLMARGPGSRFTDRESDELRRKLVEGEAIAFDRIEMPQDGLAEAFLVLGDALNTDGSARLALLYGRLAAFLQPDNAEALLLTGDILTEQQQFDLALDAYKEVPESDPLALNAKLGQVLALRRSERLDEAVSTLRDALVIEADSISLWQSLGDVYLQNDEPEAAIAAFSSAIDLLPDPDMPAAWRLYYSRAIAEHKSDDWPRAEADFRQALKLMPDEANVLNYLGYSLVERGEKLDEALEMIESAAASRPDSGAISDSLGWVYFQLGRYEEAEAEMERAVQLLPVDPILSDHYGDVLWMVDRKREARFQWRRALSYGPEPEDAVRIRDKLERGLDAVLADE